MATNFSTTHTHTPARRTGPATSSASTSTAGRRSAERRDRRRDTDSNAWRRDAVCQGDGAADFYPPFGGERKRERVAREQRAKAICATCPVARQCLQQAVAAGERYGVWGGLNFEERLSFRRSA